MSEFRPVADFDNPRRRLEADSLDDAGRLHDLGNLIQIAASAINNVDRSPSVEADPALAPALASARSALRQAGLLLRQQVDQRRDSALKLRSLPDRLDVAGCLGEILALLRWTCEPDIELTFEASAGLPPVRCGGADLQNAVLNLAINACDAMPDGGALRLTVRAGEAGDVEIRVSDDGVGMSAATLQRAFHPFFTTKLDGRSAGLGLAMVRRFAEGAGGGVEIASRPGVGTTIILRLPAAPAAWATGSG